MAPGGPTNDRAHINVLAPSGGIRKVYARPCHRRSRVGTSSGAAPLAPLSVGMGARESQAEDTLVEGEGAGAAASRASGARLFRFSDPHAVRYEESEQLASPV